MKKLLIIVFIIYLIILVKLILFKGSIFYEIVRTSENYIESSASSSVNGANFTPFNTIRGFFAGDTSTPEFFFNIFGNILLFVPYGILIPLILKNRVILIDVIYTGFILSFCFELFQLLTRTGQFDIDDVILNTLGAITGYLIFMLFRYLLEKKRENQYWKKIAKKRRHRYP